MGGHVGERNGTPAGVAVEMEAVPARIVGGPADGVDLHRYVVPLGRGAWSRVQLEVLGNGPDVVMQLPEQSGITECAGHDHPGKKDHVGIRGVHNLGSILAEYMSSETPQR